MGKERGVDTRKHRMDDCSVAIAPMNRSVRSDLWLTTIQVVFGCAFQSAFFFKDKNQPRRSKAIAILGQNNFLSSIKLKTALLFLATFGVKN